MCVYVFVQIEYYDAYAARQTVAPNIRVHSLVVALRPLLHCTFSRAVGSMKACCCSAWPTLSLGRATYVNVNPFFFFYERLLCVYITRDVRRTGQ